MEERPMRACVSYFCFFLITIGSRMWANLRGGTRLLVRNRNVHYPQRCSLFHTCKRLLDEAYFHDWPEKLSTEQSIGKSEATQGQSDFKQKPIRAVKRTRGDRKSTRLNSSHSGESRMPSSA